MDYGNECSAAYSDIRVLDPRFRDTPHQAMECELDEVQAKEDDWSEEVIEKFEELVNDKKLLMEVSATLGAGQGDQMPVYLVKLLYMGNSVSQTLLDIGLVDQKTSTGDLPETRVEPSSSTDDEVSQSPPRHSPVADDDVVGAAHPLNLNFAETPKKVQQTKVASGVAFSIGTKMEASVVHIESLVEFYLQRKSSSEQLQSLVDVMQEYCENNKDDVESLEQDQIVVAKSSIDETWYRARIIDITDELILVQFVDYGNTEEVERTAIQSVMQDFRDLPVQAIQCKLYGVVPCGETWSDEAIDAFSAATSDKYLLAEIRKGEQESGYVVSLLDMGQSIAKILIEQEVVNADDLADDLVDDLADDEVLQSPTRHSPVADDDVAGAAHPLNLNFAETPKKVQQTKVASGVAFSIGTKMEASVVHIESLAEFYLQRKSSSEQLQSLVDVMQEYCENNKDDVESLEQDQIVVAKSSIDETWYRARIIDITDELILVQFVDYGNTEEVEKTAIQSVMQDFRDLPVQAIQCKLYGVVPCGETWSDEALDAFSAATSDKYLLAEIRQEEQESGYVVSLLDMGQSIAKILIDQEVVNADCLAQDAAKLDMTLDVTCDHPETPDTGAFKDKDDKIIADLTTLSDLAAEEMDEVEKVRSDDAEVSSVEDLNSIDEPADDQRTVGEASIIVEEPVNDFEKVIKATTDIPDVEETVEEEVINDLPAVGDIPEDLDKMGCSRERGRFH